MELQVKPFVFKVEPIEPQPAGSRDTATAGASTDQRQQDAQLEGQPDDDDQETAQAVHEQQQRADELLERERDISTDRRIKAQYAEFDRLQATASSNARQLKEAMRQTAAHETAARAEQQQHADTHQGDQQQQQEQQQQGHIKQEAQTQPRDVLAATAPETPTPNRVTFTDRNLYAIPSRTPTPEEESTLPAENTLLKDTVCAMAQLGLYGFGTTIALSVEASEFADAARAVGQHRLADRAARMSSAARQAGLNMQHLAAGLVPVVDSAAASGAMSVTPFITRNLTANAIADTLDLHTMAHADEHLLNRYHKSTTATTGLLPPSAEVAFRAATMVLPMTEDHPIAIQTATALKTALAATLPPTKGRKRTTSGKGTVTFQSLMHFDDLVKEEDVKSEDSASKAHKATRDSLPTLASAQRGRRLPTDQDEVIDLED